ncbi:hypothetical protein GCM10007907_30270 [Chitinimonas prasina]|uniref:Transposase IS30-like HTH domain-containing protein n=1 Tax=Chitinimonas prasina TaxID=1434937 RepID=A0ABQ5YGV4_9NEIS|nr:hypothetical protein GCM10007907_30270 [Chitinimonas prasina]
MGGFKAPVQLTKQGLKVGRDEGTSPTFDRQIREPMPSHQRLTEEERYQIEAYVRCGQTLAEIARDSKYACHPSLARC